MLRSFVAGQFWGGHPNTFRTFFAWASLSYAVSIYLVPEAFNGKPYRLMHMAASLNTWAVMFAMHWLLVSLVVLPHARDSVQSFLSHWTSWSFTHRHEVWLQLAINCYGFFVWGAYVILQDCSLGYPALNAAMERIALIYSVWAILRTGMGRRTDRA